MLKISAPKPDTRFVAYNQHLALFQVEKNQQAYWQKYWHDKDYLTTLLEMGTAGDAGEFSVIFDKYLLPGQCVIEAGCGPAHLVAAMMARGCSAIGIDYELKVVQYVNSIRPELDVRVGNILDLQFADGYFDAYISIGVVEHFSDGPLTALKEARRVLKLGGKIFVSVPYLNPLRSKFLSALPFGDNSMNFHQYYFSIEEFSAVLKSVGFRILDTHPYALQSFLTREHPVFSKFWKSPLARNQIRNTLRKSFEHAPLWMRNRYAHMMMFIAQAI